MGIDPNFDFNKTNKEVFEKVKKPVKVSRISLKLLEYKFRYLLITLSLPLVLLILSKLYQLGIIDYLERIIIKQYALTTNVVSICMTKENFANMNIFFKCINTISKY
ncbi:MAG: hypothetical protein U1E31_00900 [Rickettsiales bacterium]